MTKLLLWGCATLLSFVISLNAAIEQKEIVALYRRGLAGDKEAVDQCIAALEQVTKSQPSNQLARVYLGSAYTLRSRGLGFGPKKLRTLKQGLAIMDEAVAAAPDDPKVRLARALTTSALPGFFGRATQSRQDFLELANLAQRDREKFDKGDLPIIYYNAGLAAKHDGDKARAIALWEQGVRNSDDATLTAKMKSELAKLK